MAITESASRAADEPQFGSVQLVQTIRTGWSVYALAVCIGAGVFAAGIFLDWWLLPGRRPVLYSDGFAGIVAGLLAYFALRTYDRRRQELSLRLTIIGHVNHHVRNAITAVMLKVQLKDDAELMQITDSAAKRIDWVLRDVLPRDLTMR